MSDSQKQRLGTTPIKNPLLSASVTGLTFDDFPNKPLLLPAAPPIVHSSVTPVVSPGLMPREHKSLVTVGSSSLDSENLDEINLNTSNEDSQTSDINDANANPFLEQSNQNTNTDSILSQAASSFSALPSVASNVFSTFSKRITAISSRETTPVYDQYQQDPNTNFPAPQLDIQPPYIQQAHPGDSAQTPTPFYAPPTGGSYAASTYHASSQEETQTSLPSLDPPKFYTPADVPPVPAISATSSTTLGGPNNFRFSSKKKLYAPIPGLSDQSPSAVNASISYDSSSNYYSQPPLPASEQPKPEERKLSSGLFSKISNLAPTGVLQNISGLVQSAAGTLTQTNKADPYQQAPPPAIDQQHCNYFVSPSTNYFIPPPLSGQQLTPESTSLTAESTSLTVGISAAAFSPPTLSPASLETSQAQIPLYNSSNLPIQSEPSSNLSVTPSSEQLTPAFFNTNQTNPTETVSNITTQVSFFDPAKYPPSSVCQASYSLPPTTSHKVPPPVSGHTSYRLQKGTKLYKNPLSPQETAAIQATPNQIQAINPSANIYSTSQSFSTSTPQKVQLFASPPGGEQNLVQSVPLIAPPPTTLFAEPAQSVSLFAPSAPIDTDLSSDRTTQSASLFIPAGEDLKSKEPSSNISLFTPLNNPTLEGSKSEEHTPPAKKLKSDESLQDIPKFNAPIEHKNLSESVQSAGTQISKPLEPSENKLVTQVPKQHTNSDIDDNNDSQPIFEPIEPVFEENLTKTLKDAIADPLEETLQSLSLTETASETKAVKLPPIIESFKLNNPYRRGSGTETAKPAPSLPSLANFFTPEPSKGSTDLNFFATLPTSQASSGGSGFNFFSETVADTLSSKDILDTDKSQSVETNFFTTAVPPELVPQEPHTTVHPPISAFFPTFPTSLGIVPAVLEEENLPPPPIEFESFTQSEPTTSDNTTLPPLISPVQRETTTSQTQQPEVVNRFSNYFNKKNPQQQEVEISKDPSAFFDSFSGQHPPEQQQQQLDLTIPGVESNEEQRLQYFFNNPPPKDASAVGDLNYDLVHSGLAIKNLQHRSQTPISNLAEPPSSACSEFSEISNSTAGQKSIAANLSITEEDTSKSGGEVEEQDSIAKNYENLPEEILLELRMANLLTADSTAASVSYKPAVKHWFFKRIVGDKQIWVPFSHYDSALLETSLFMEEDDDKQNIVAVEGGRYDVNINERKKTSVYWDSQPIEVRRCSWFYKAVDSKYVPYEEQTAEVLESEYKQAAESGVWHKTIVLGMGEQVVFHGPTVIVHFQQQQNTDAWGGTTQTATRPRVVKRDLDDFHIEQGESQKVDHLLFMVHGIGSACDLRLRSVEEVVEDFRTIARQLVQSHYKNSTDLGLVGRVEVLPISWHSHLHSVEMGIDEKLRMITLESIPKLRNFTNDTLLDILFYTSPTFCQKIMSTIVSSMNTLYLKYRERHPEFNGGVSLAGHSLGSLILFDLLCHQNPLKESEENNLKSPNQLLNNTPMDSNQLEDSQTSYTMGPAGTGQPFINYSQLIFQPKKFFALGSPIGMFVTIRGIDKLGLDFRLPTCPGFYNIFHPYDPVAYRIEALVNPDLSGVRPVLIPHHKGRKRMHLELKETMTRVSTDLKNRFLDKFKTTLESVNIFGSASKSTKEAEELMEKEVDKVIQMQMQLEQRNHNKNSNDNLPSGSHTQNEAAAGTTRSRTDSVSTAMSDDIVEIDFPLGKLNDSKRIDYVLQEAPLEFINEYIFALSSHVCYWDSEDTILFVMKEIYAGLGISPDSQVPQQTMTIERPSPLLFMFL